MADTSFQKSPLPGPNPQIQEAASKEAGCSPRPIRPRFLNPSTFVTFYIGKPQDQTKFVVHKEFIYHCCPVFKAAFENDRFIEGQTQEYHLDDTTKEAFGLFVTWVYSGFVEYLKYPLFRPEENGGQEALKEITSLVELWVLADKLILPKLQNAVIRVIEGTIYDTRRYYTEVLHYVWENTAPESMLHRYFLTLHSYAPHDRLLGIKNGGEEHKNHFPDGYWKELACFMLQDINPRDPPPGWSMNFFTVPEIKDFYVEPVEERDRRPARVGKGRDPESSSPAPRL